MPQAAQIDPSLTTFQVPRRAMGRRAADLLLRQIAQPAAKPIQEVMGGELIVRNSTAPAAPHDAVTDPPPASASTHRSE